jgi:3-hydroxypropanoate dehydrogenase
MGTPLNEAGLDTIFRTARTYNGYLPGEVTEADIGAIYDLLKMGPTSANMQPARFVWCLSQEAKDKLAACASEKNAPKISAAPAAVVIGMDYDFHEQLPWLFPHTDAKSWFEGPQANRVEGALRNSSLQGAYFLIAARALGWDTGPMSGFDAAKVDAAFFSDKPSVHANFIATFGKGDPASIFGRSPRPEFGQFNQIA